MPAAGPVDFAEVTMPLSDMRDYGAARLTDKELYAFFDRMFPQGFAGADVVAEIAPEGWEHSPLLACFHPSVERVFEESVLTHRNLEELRRIRVSKHGPADPDDAREPAPTLDDVRRNYEPRPVKQQKEITELMGFCLWDTFSDNHEVIASDGRCVDLGSFRGSSAFLDEYLHDYRNTWREGDDMRFYLGSMLIRGRADLAPVYALIFRRLKVLGANWVYHFPEVYLTDFSAADMDSEPQKPYSVSEAAVAELDAQKKRRRIERIRADLAADNARAREEAMDRPPPGTVRAYREVYGRDPRGWPPI
jgi:hypothetical protein